jgi:hypothetical protein
MIAANQKPSHIWFLLFLFYRNKKEINKKKAFIFYKAPKS